MEYLFDSIEEVMELVVSKKKIFLFLDYDGTITPIVEEPDLAVLSDETRELLRSMAASSKYTLCIVSGRPAADVRRLSGLENICYIGNHGLEVEGPCISYVDKAALRTRSLINEVYMKLAGSLSGIAGVLAEHKNLSLAIHYRMVPENRVSEVRDIFKRVVEPYVKKGEVKVAENKKTLEVLPNGGFNKGNTLLRLAYSLAQDGDFLPVYLGDDATDEDAFSALGDKGISVLVSEDRKESQAKYYVRDVPEVLRFLRLLAEVRR